MTGRARWGRRVAGFTMAAGAISLAGFVLASDVGLFSPGNFTLHFAIIAIGLGLIAWLAFPSQPDNGMVWALAWAALFGAVSTIGQMLVAVYAPSFTTLGQVEMLSPSQLPLAGGIGATLMSGAWVGAMFTVLGIGLLLFPDGKPPSKRWYWLVWWNGGLIAVQTVGQALSSSPWRTTLLNGGEDAISAILWELLFPLVIGMVLAIISLVVRYRRSSGTARKQIQWIALGGASFLIGAFAERADRFSWLLLVGEILLIAAFFIAITKYRLYEIDVVMSKTLTYGLLTVVIGLLYTVAILGYVNVFADPQQRSTGDLGLALPIGATVIVAVAFEPIRTRLQRFANRLVYGKRAAPSEVLSELAAQLAASSVGESLDGLARLLQEGTGSASSTVWLRIGDRLRADVSFPPDAEARVSDLDARAELPGNDLELTVPVLHGGDMLGALGIAKPRAHAVTPADEDLLEDVAAAAGLSLRNRLLNTELAERAAELRASRRRLIAAHDSVRHRLERDLHDGAQQQVVALKVKLGLARALAEREGADHVAARVVSLADQTQDAVDAMRTVARGIYPPLLEAEGLVAALGAVHRSVSLPVHMQISDLSRYSRQLEDTVYFCVLAAISRAEMAGAPSVDVEVHHADGRLTADVTYGAADDGTNLAPISDRIDAFGGEVAIATSTAGATTLALAIPIIAEVMAPA